MNEKKNLTTEETFDLAVQNHKKNNFKVAENLYNKVLKINPNHFKSIYLLGSLLIQTKNFIMAIQLLNRAILMQPKHAATYNNLGAAFKELGEHEKSITYFQKAIEIQPNYAEAHNNFGMVFEELGELQKAVNYYQQAIQINPNYVEAHNNLGIVFEEFGQSLKAISCYKKAIQINPNYSDAYWNLHSFASDIDEALTILKKLYANDNKFIRAKIMIGTLQGFKGNFTDFDILMASPESNHPYARSAKWVFSLPKLPKIFFNRWDFFDAVIALTDKSRFFYEFGVWNGISFQYLINIFKKGFGFDTFTGLPEDWHHERAGTYSSFGSVPKIAGGEFIVGKFEDTLPKFFSQKRPLASLINFDADLYSSTLCALNYSNKVIDEKSILIFDEFITNKYWEKDEYKALNEFCDNFSISYDVLAVSFFTKQVAVKLKKN